MTANKFIYPEGSWSYRYIPQSDGLPVTSKDKPWCHCAVDSLEVVLQPLILRRRLLEVVLGAHENEVDVSIVEPVPAGGRNSNKYCSEPALSGSDN